MTQNEIKTVVSETVNELLAQSMIKYSDVVIYEKMSDKLREHYIKPDPDVTQALSQMKDMAYYEILEMYYKHNWTLESIAEDLGVDISTITRNKKSLCIKLFNLIN